MFIGENVPPHNSIVMYTSSRSAVSNQPGHRDPPCPVMMRSRLCASRHKTPAFPIFSAGIRKKNNKFTFNNSTVVPGRKSMLGTLHFRTSLQMPSTWSIIKFCCSFHLALCLTLIFGSNLSVIDRWYITGMVFSAVYL